MIELAPSWQGAVSLGPETAAPSLLLSAGSQKCRKAAGSTTTTSTKHKGAKEAEKQAHAQQGECKYTGSLEAKGG